MFDYLVITVAYRDEIELWKELNDRVPQRWTRGLNNRSASKEHYFGKQGNKICYKYHAGMIICLLNDS